MHQSLNIFLKINAREILGTVQLLMNERHRPNASLTFPEHFESSFIFDMPGLKIEQTANNL